MTTLLLDIGSTNLITLTGLKDTVTGDYPTDATVTATLYPSSSTTPVGGAENLVLAYVPTTTGAATQYRGVIPASVAATLLIQPYLLIVTATDANNNVRVFYVPCSAVKAAA
jgi:hypothetical protein